VFTTGTRPDQSVWKLGIAYSTNGGVDWNHILLDDGCMGLAVAFDRFDADRVYVGGYTNSLGAALFVSGDLGQTWTSGSTGLAGQVNCIVPDPATQNVVYCATTSGVYVSFDGCQSWQSTALTQNTRALLVDPDDGRIYAGTATGVYYSFDCGSTWYDFSANLTTTNVLALARTGGPTPMLLAGTDDGGIFSASLMTGIAGSTPTRPARAVSVTSPCRDAISIAFGSGVPAQVSGGIFDRTGRKVLDLGRMNPTGPGCYSEFDIRQLPAGTYLLRLAAANWSAVRPLVVMH
jgi:hypothetical protein